MPTANPARSGPLPPATKAVFALGDHTLNFTLSALSLFYLYFLTEYVGLRPSLAALVLLTGRAVDAFSDPLMGRVSDQTRSRRGRRRPYFLLGALPFGVSFAALWMNYGVEAQLAKFVTYAGVYILYSLASTVLAVPYMALLPEMALEYQERTSMNTYRAIAAVAGTLLAAGGFRTLANAFGGAAAGFAAAAVVAGLWVIWPWFLIYRSTWERPRFRRQSTLSFAAGMGALFRHRSYRQLASLYLCSRVAMDVVGAMFIFFFQYWLRRPGDFEPTLVLMLLAVVVSLPFWLRVSHSRDKTQIFIIGAAWWIATQTTLWFVTPEWPRWVIFAVAVCAGIGYAVADMMPWAMLGDVIDEDELNTGERREGLYAGTFTFLRKLAGASAVAVAGLALDLAGFVGGQEPPAAALFTIRALTAGAPMFFLAIAIALAVRYPITRRRHHEILAAVAARSR